ncbi:GntR family transcriptional regulator [Micromonospora sp. LOL_015]|uniref:GntR family transcriptional regulator n=1 Tax=Micromonospora sp. LOL_015 TaxID=3345416 RepID=UPI003A8872AD
MTSRLGISRAPLREALRLLAEQGLVEHVPRRGVAVRRLEPNTRYLIRGRKGIWCSARWGVQLISGGGGCPAADQPYVSSRVRPFRRTSRTRRSAACRRHR